jgi:hypothetical protein
MGKSYKEYGGKYTRICVVRGRVFGLSSGLNRSTPSRFYEINPNTLETETKDVQIAAGTEFTMLPNEDLGQIVVWGGTHIYPGDEDRGRCIIWVIQIETLGTKIHNLKAREDQMYSGSLNDHTRSGLETCPSCRWKYSIVHMLCNNKCEITCPSPADQQYKFHKPTNQNIDL